MHGYLQRVWRPKQVRCVIHDRLVHRWLRLIKEEINIWCTTIQEVCMSIHRQNFIYAYNRLWKSLLCMEFFQGNHVNECFVHACDWHKLNNRSMRCWSRLTLYKKGDHMVKDDHAFVLKNHLSIHFNENNNFF